jgi:hypothetical protein
LSSSFDAVIVANGTIGFISTGGRDSISPGVLAASQAAPENATMAPTCLGRRSGHGARAAYPGKSRRTPVGFPAHGRGPAEERVDHRCGRTHPGPHAAGAQAGHVEPYLAQRVAAAQERRPGSHELGPWAGSASGP